MLPVVALVGRPNVGKSTLFNRLTKTQDALVANYPGLTRDRQYGYVTHNSKRFMVVDTGGIGVLDADVDALMSEQSHTAMTEASYIVFVVDGRDGRLGLDETIAKKLRRWNKPVYLLINKIDGIGDSNATVEFAKLGFDKVYMVSASHGRGIHSFLDDLTETFPQEEELLDDNDAIRITFAGRPNVGKSTLINRMLGEERVVVYDMPGTTRDSIAIPFTRDNQDYVLVDTAGVRRRSRVDDKIEKFSIIKTLDAIQKAHICVVLIDAREGVTDQDMTIIRMVIEAGKGLVIAVNKWDGLEQDHKERVVSEIERHLQFAHFARVRYISALHGSGVGVLWDDIMKSYASANQKMSTPMLTRLLEQFVFEHAPPLVNGRRIKMRYAHAGGHNPPIIVIHGNQLASLPDSYKRYLNKCFATALKLTGTPLELQFKGGENPYKGKKNVLSERQVKKKRRMMKHIKKKHS